MEDDSFYFPSDDFFINGETSIFNADRIYDGRNKEFFGRRKNITYQSIINSRIKVYNEIKDKIIFPFIYISPPINTSLLILAPPAIVMAPPEV